MIPPLTIADVQARVCAHYGLPPSTMTTDRRWRKIAWPRQTAMYLARRLTFASLPQIGRRFGGRDHSTVFFALSQVEKRRAADPVLDADIRALTAELERHAYGELLSGRHGAAGLITACAVVRAGQRENHDGR